MQITEIVLYSKKGDKRTVPFNKGKVNIITGGSGTGKSALIDIVEYCMGRGTCGVPEGIIRETVSWFGVLLELNTEKIFIARKNPVNQQTSGDVYIEVGENVSSPAVPPNPNTNAESLVEYLTQKVGISPNLHQPPEGQTRDALEANIKHALFLCFQQQDEIASKRILFHRSTDGFINQSIKDTLPYFLGAIQEDRLVIEQKLTRLKRELKKAKRKLNEVENIKGDTATKGTALLAEAEQVGLIKMTDYPSELGKIIALLSGIVHWDSGDDLSIPGSDKLSEYQTNLRRLQNEYNEITDQINAAKTFQYDVNGYTNEVHHQELRLESIGLYSNSNSDHSKCPICSSTLETSIPTVIEINNSLAKVKSNLEMTSKERPRLVEYINNLIEHRDQIYENINKFNQLIDGLYEERKAAKEHKDINIRRGKVVGRISLWLESVDKEDNITQLQSRVESLKTNIEELEKELDTDKKDEHLNSILNRIGYKMTRWAEELGLEHSGDPVRLNLKDTTVVVDREDRPIPLYRMGSGENWVGYHLIAHLALHSYLTEHERPVPRFLFLDQPTQVYYPRDKDTLLQGSIDNLKDDDREAVNKMFDLIMDVVEMLDHKFQIIITDHADIANDKFQNAIIERWRGQALIPDSWKENN
ncbi:DUF3732 domain-containing protein [Oceanobacillus bengalensis]|uniref:Nuclease SbcCD subunit C n=1 Tax=Oceanobacillus bengalensis TaxID=1435466 RepID=A0A494YY93_9BACI|nr:DUF3732 domain-containing protein [Oceanobacillus bengalensis]RKQ15177.1 DUF3732 domain-containing protein [Oceanobacillus bengalensis]